MLCYISILFYKSYIFKVQTALYEIQTGQGGTEREPPAPADPDFRSEKTRSSKILFVYYKESYRCSIKAPVIHLTGALDFTPARIRKTAPDRGW